jgi:phosphohistidine phosphatase SixA
MDRPEQSGRGLLLAFAAALILTVGIMGLMAAIGAGADPTSQEGGGAADETAGTAALIAEMQDGGEVLFFRHTITDRSQSDADAVTRGTCDMQRNLNDEGVQQARDIYTSMEAQGIAGGPMFASPFCRGIDTALAMLDLPTGQGADPGPVEVVESLRNTTSAAGDTAIRDQIIAESRQLILDNLGGPDTVVMVGHINNIIGLFDVSIEEGDAVVVGQSDDGDLEVLGVIPWTDW